MWTGRVSERRHTSPAPLSRRRGLSPRTKVPRLSPSASALPWIGRRESGLHKRLVPPEDRELFPSLPPREAKPLADIPLLRGMKVGAEFCLWKVHDSGPMCIGARGGQESRIWTD